MKITIQITNRGKIVLTDVKPLYCSHYRYLTGFPQYVNNFEHTYVIMDGRITSLAMIPTRIAGADVKGAPVIGCPQRGDWFAEEHGGLPLSLR